MRFNRKISVLMVLVTAMGFLAGYGSAAQEYTEKHPLATEGKTEGKSLRHDLIAGVKGAYTDLKETVQGIPNDMRYLKSELKGALQSDRDFFKHRPIQCFVYGHIDAATGKTHYSVGVGKTLRGMNRSDEFLEVIPEELQRGTSADGRVVGYIGTDLILKNVYLGSHKDLQVEAYDLCVEAVANMECVSMRLLDQQNNTEVGSWLSRLPDFVDVYQETSRGIHYSSLSSCEDSMVRAGHNAMLPVFYRRVEMDAEIRVESRTMKGRGRGGSSQGTDKPNGRGSSSGVRR